MYKDQKSEIRKSQWEGWKKYMHDWMTNESFRKSWEVLGSQWEENFINYMHEVFDNTQEAHDKKKSLSEKVDQTKL